MRHILLMTICIFTLSVPSIATIQIDAVVTCDNHYGLYYGSEDGADLTFVGRNEYGTGGDPGMFNWMFGEQWAFSVEENQYLYAICWDDNLSDNYSGLLGDFLLSCQENSVLRHTDLTWEGNITDLPPIDPTGEVPSDGELTAVIQAFNSDTAWVPVFGDIYNSEIWSQTDGSVSNISEEALWVWIDGYIHEHGRTPFLFRFQIPSEDEICPTPTTEETWSTMKVLY